MKLYETLRLLVQEGKKNVVLNMAKVSVIDSSGLGELISSYATLEKNGGTLKLLSLPPRVTELMTITKLVTVFDIFDSEADAIASFDKTPEKVTQPIDGKIAIEAAAGSSLL